MSSWKNESVEYRNRLCERYGIIEEKFDKQAFNEDPIAYFESINYELHGTEWISAMWNLLKLAKTDSSLVKKQLGPNGQKVAQILKTIVDKNPTLKALVTEKQKSMTPEIEATADKILMAEGTSLLKKYDRLLDDNVLNEGFKDWWSKKSTKAKVLIIAGIIAAILIIAGIIYYVATKDSSGTQAITQMGTQVVQNAAQNAAPTLEQIANSVSTNDPDTIINGIGLVVKNGLGNSDKVVNVVKDLANQAGYTFNANGGQGTVNSVVRTLTSLFQEGQISLGDLLKLAGKAGLAAFGIGG